MNEAPCRQLEEYTVMMLDFSEINDKSIEKIDDKNYFNNHIVPISFDDKIYSLKPTEKIVQFDTIVLDLCSLNNNGQANAEYNNSYREYKSIHSERYYTNEFQDNLKQKLQKFDIYKDICVEGKEKLLKERLISLKYGVKFNENKFEMKRICRLESKRTVLLVQNYIHNISLVGVDTPIVNDL